MKQAILSFHDLYSRYANDIYKFAYWLCGDREEANDIASETFVRALTTETELRAESVKGYLLTIARNLFLKNRERHGRYSTIDESIADPGPSPHQKLEHDSEMESALALLRQLPELDRTLLLMHAEGELSLKDIAAATGLSLAAVKVRIHRARIKLVTLQQTQEAVR